jgi:DNA-binding response OmpR family regulator
VASLAEQIAIASTHVETSTSLTRWFDARGFVVRTCQSLAELIRAVRVPRLRLIVLHEDLQGIPAAEAGLRVRWHGVRAPMILLSREFGPEVERRALDAGASSVLAHDDLERIHLHAETLIARARGAPVPVIRRGPFLVDVLNAWFEYDHRRIELTPGQVRILWFLCLNANTLVRLEELVAEVGGAAPNPSSMKAMAQQVMRLRVRLGPLRDCIETTRGAGYRLRVP